MRSTLRPLTGAAHAILGCPMLAALNSGSPPRSRRHRGRGDGEAAQRRLLGSLPRPQRHRHHRRQEHPAHVRRQREHPLEGRAARCRQRQPRRLGQAPFPPLGQQRRQAAKPPLPRHDRRQNSLAEEHLRGSRQVCADSSLASSTPTTDGKAVYVSFWDGKDIRVSAYDFQGDVLWSKNLGTFNSQHGPGASPILYKDKLILANDMDKDDFTTRVPNARPSMLIALDKRTGRLLWETPRVAERACYSAPFLLLQTRTEGAGVGRHEHHGGDRLRCRERREALGSEGLARARRQGAHADGGLPRTGRRHLVRVQRRRRRQVRHRPGLARPRQHRRRPSASGKTARTFLMSPAP